MLNVAVCHTILAHYIKGALNVVANLASRIDCVVNTEWALSTHLFQWIQSQSPWKPAVIDLFANSFNHRLPLYLSSCPKPCRSMHWWFLGQGHAPCMFLPDNDCRESAAIDPERTPTTASLSIARADRRHVVSPASTASVRDVAS